MEALLAPQPTLRVLLSAVDRLIDVLVDEIPNLKGRDQIMIVCLGFAEPLELSLIRKGFRPNQAQRAPSRAFLDGGLRRRFSMLPLILAWDQPIPSGVAEARKRTRDYFDANEAQLLGGAHEAS